MLGARAVCCASASCCLQVDAATRCRRAVPQALEQEEALAKHLKEVEASLKVCGGGGGVGAGVHANDGAARTVAAMHDQACTHVASSTHLAVGAQALIESEAHKRQRRDIEKKMTVHVQQISATTDQVRGAEGAVARAGLMMSAPSDMQPACMGA